MSAIHGLAQAFFTPAATGLVPQLVAAERLQPANALLDLSRGTTAIVGQLLGGAIVGSLGAGTAYALDSLTFLVSASALAVLRPGGIVRTKAAGALLSWGMAGANSIREHGFGLASFTSLC